MIQKNSNDREVRIEVAFSATNQEQTRVKEALTSEFIISGKRHIYFRMGDSEVLAIFIAVAGNIVSSLFYDIAKKKVQSIARRLAKDKTIKREIWIRTEIQERVITITINKDGEVHTEEHLSESKVTKWSDDL
jgi:hypothetical protein